MLAAAVLAALSVGTWLLTWNLTGPINGHHEWNTAMYGIHARNHLAWGLGVTRGLCTWGATAEPPPQPDYYLNHPPLISWWAAAAILVLGDTEAALRMVPIAATLGSVLLLVLLVRTAAARMAVAAPFARDLLAGAAAIAFVLLPGVAYFGRMLDHLAPVQFLSLLMLWGWLAMLPTRPTALGTAAGENAAHPGKRSRSLRAAALFAFAAGTILGIGTGWAAVLMAALVGLAQLWRCIRGRREWGLLGLAVALPLAALSAVVLHIAWARGWDFSQFIPMFASRAAGTQKLLLPGPAAWLARQGEYWLSNFTWAGALAPAAAALAVVIVARRRRPAGPGAAGELARRTPAAGVTCTDAAALGRAMLLPFGLSAVQGALYLLLLRERAYLHDYWQLLLAPAIACCIGLAITLAAALVARWSRVAALLAAAVLLAAPLPAALASLRLLHAKRQVPPSYIEAYQALQGLVPRRAPVLVSRPWPQETEQFGTYVNRWPMPIIGYYADRPLIAVATLQDIEAGRGAAAAYLHERGRGDMREATLLGELGRRFKQHSVGGHHVIYLLDR